MTEGTELAITDTNARDFLAGHAQALGAFKVRSYRMNEFLNSALLCITDDKDLLGCIKTKDGQRSLYHALKYGATTGLSLNPQEGKAALVVFNKKVQYMVMKNGLIELALESGQVQSIMADMVKENDDFKIVKHTDGDGYSFSPALRKRGEVIGFFAACKLKDGTSKVHWMTVEEIKDHADRYSAAKKSADATLADEQAEEWKKKKALDTPWIKSFNGMAIKTVIKYLLANLHLSKNISAAIGADLQSDFIEVTRTETNGSTSTEVKEIIEAGELTVDEELPEGEQRTDDII
jgi:recombination protein RecT